MARITVEDCLTKENNRFALVQLAAKRTKQILGGAKALVSSSNKAVVTSLREIAVGKVRFMTPEEAEQARIQEEAEKQAMLEQATSTKTLSPSVAANIDQLLSVSDDDDDSDDDEDVTEVGEEDEEDDDDDVSDDLDDDSSDEDEEDKGDVAPVDEEDK
jgi:DNA-directed RNA polymerase subunit omega